MDSDPLNVGEGAPVSVVSFYRKIYLEWEPSQLFDWSSLAPVNQDNHVSGDKMERFIDLLHSVEVTQPGPSTSANGTQVDQAAPENST